MKTKTAAKTVKKTTQTDLYERRLATVVAALDRCKFSAQLRQELRGLWSNILSGVVEAEVAYEHSILHFFAERNVPVKDRLKLAVKNNQSKLVDDFARKFPKSVVWVSIDEVEWLRFDGGSAVVSMPEIVTETITIAIPERFRGKPYKTHFDGFSGLCGTCRYRIQDSDEVRTVKILPRWISGQFFQHVSLAAEE
jgi:hypothetical protein